MRRRGHRLLTPDKNWRRPSDCPPSRPSSYPSLALVCRVPRLPQARRPTSPHRECTTDLRTGRHTSPRPRHPNPRLARHTRGRKRSPPCGRRARVAAWAWWSWRHWSGSSPGCSAEPRPTSVSSACAAPRRSRPCRPPPPGLPRGRRAASPRSRPRPCPVWSRSGSKARTAGHRFGVRHRQRRSHPHEQPRHRVRGDRFGHHLGRPVRRDDVRSHRRRPGRGL